ncbi:unnamed protein product [Acanthoscelides obtectus]|uniref:Lipocalin/cytosolic fatty-acid binding domain-containing protein n=1 Tax=Acanthoscelides obtectus TaxID=200917 RepID=A0A9P0Q128_ACAOB|nr:unnamed protein product [Acanthoscelides obtectus]CAK1668573.1 Fatty acid-binding protein, heart [Acanthoscelides obtectus]
MVQIAGKYKLEKNENFVELLKKQGIPEEHAKHANEDRALLTVEVNGDKIKLTTQSALRNSEVEFHVGKAIQEDIAPEYRCSSTAKLVGNTLTIESIPTDGRAKSLTRVYTFTDTGIEVVVTMNDGGSTTEAKRIYKRQ